MTILNKSKLLNFVLKICDFADFVCEIYHCFLFSFFLIIPPFLFNFFIKDYSKIVLKLISFKINLSLNQQVYPNSNTISTKATLTDRQTGYICIVEYDDLVLGKR